MWGRRQTKGIFWQTPPYDNSSIKMANTEIQIQMQKITQIQTEIQNVRNVKICWTKANKGNILADTTVR